MWGEKDRFRRLTIKQSKPPLVFMKIASFIKEKRKNLGLTQTDLAEKAGVGLRFVRDMEQGKPTLRLDKVNQVLDLFGSEMGVIRKEETEGNENKKAISAP
jgi:y4mF family transcriptional regulator